MCQCPISGFSHFYVLNLATLKKAKIVSMPYIGLLPFLLFLVIMKRILNIVSMPYIGLLPFLRGR